MFTGIFLQPSYPPLALTKQRIITAVGDKIRESVAGDDLIDFAEKNDPVFGTELKILNSFVLT